MTDTPTAPAAESAPSTLPIGSNSFDALWDAHSLPTSSAEPVTSKDAPSDGGDEEIKEGTTEGTTTQPPTVKEETEEPTDDVKAESAPKPEKTDFKILKAKDGDKELELNEDIVIMKKVDGKEVPVKLADALADYAGQTVIKQRFSQLHSEKQAFKAELDNINGKFKTVTDLVLEGNPHSAIEALAQMAGKDPVEFTQSYLSTVEQIANEWSKMTPEQRELFLANKRSKVLESKLKEKDGALSQVELKRQAAEQRLTVQREASLTDQQYENLHELLANSEYFAGKEIGPQDVAALAGEMRHLQKVNTALTLVNPEFVNDEAFVDRIATVTESHPDLSAEDIADIVREVRGLPKQSIENLNKKVQKAQRSGNRSAPVPATSQKKEPTSWDDL